MAFDAKITEEPSSPSSHSGALVEVRDLNVAFVSRESTTRAVNGVSFSINPGEVLCIIGESGSGKSVTMRSLLKLHSRKHTNVSGFMRVGQHEVSALHEKEMRHIRGSQISMIFQEPMTSLDPVYRIGDQIAETVMRHKKCSRADGYARALELLKLVGVPSPERRLKAYPHELSGGLRQRAMIAVALSCSPKLLLADEPTTALDATVQIQVLVLLRRLQQEMGMAVIFVTHDLSVAAQIADKVAVMYAGSIVEYGPVGEVLGKPSHPYTIGMLASTVTGQLRGQDIDAVPGSPPDMRLKIEGCSFAPRCSRATADCRVALPSLKVVSPSHEAACIKL
jgi:peptide/nickel transport system ATP-binding protein